jgi:hypothetical protein
VRKGSKETRTLAQFHLEDHGQVAISAQGLKVEMGEAAKFAGGGGDGIQFGTGMAHECIERSVDSGHEQFFLISEVEIDGAIGNGCSVGDIRDSR